MAVRATESDGPERTRGRPGDDRPTLLVLTQRFPPTPGGGVIRIAKLVKYLPRFGWDVEVVTPRAPAPEHPFLEGDVVEPAIRVTRTFAADLQPARRLLSDLKSALLAWMPDAASAAGAGPPAPARPFQRRYSPFLSLFRGLGLVDDGAAWTPWMTAAALAAVRRRPSIACMLTTSPPFSVAAGALAAKFLTRLPWIVDYRDMWTGDPYLPSLTRWHARAERALEARVLGAADRVLATSGLLAGHLESIGPTGTAGKLTVLPNGFDEEDFPDEAPAPSDGTFRILHAGSLYGRSLAGFCPALRRALEAHPRLATALEVVLLGPKDAEAEAEFARHALTPWLRTLGARDHGETVRRMREADLLLSVQVNHPGYAWAVPGKLFEYFAAGRPVLALGPAGDQDALVRGLAAGCSLRGEDVEGISGALRRHFEAFLAGGRMPRAPREAVRGFSRRELAGRLADVLRETVARSARRT
ncbi:MAG: glycosyltransferase [Planctomycetes bacterium]|nr:glycosyltransferase [Planctomycetota bacterium]